MLVDDRKVMCLNDSMRGRPEVFSLEGVTFETVGAILAQDPGFVALDFMPTGGWRTAIIASQPQSVFSLSGGFVTIDGNTTIDSPVDSLTRFMERAEAFPSDGYLPFSGGTIGYVGFEGVRALTGFDPAPGFSRFPQVMFGIYPVVIVFDRVEDTTTVICNKAISSDAKIKALELIKRIELSKRTKEFEANAFYHDEFPPNQIGFTHDSEFEYLCKEAGFWLKAEKLRSINVAKHSLMPASENDVVQYFLNGWRKNSARAIFKHGASYALISGAVTSVRKESSRYVPFSGRLGDMVFARTLCGKPMEKAISFIEKNEKKHRGLYGGAFGIIDSENTFFWTAESAILAADGVWMATTGLELATEIHNSNGSGVKSEKPFSTAV